MKLEKERKQQVTKLEEKLKDRDPKIMELLEKNEAVHLQSEKREKEIFNLNFELKVAAE